jgi:adhesin transport system outer membrane protein
MQNKFVKFCAVSLLVLGAATAAHAAPGEDTNLTLIDAVSKGVLKNPEYGVVANNVLATKEEENQAKALWMPSIDLQAESGTERTSSSVVPSNTLWHNRANLSLTQLLFDGFGTQSEIERQKYRVESAAHRVGEVSEFTGLDAVQAYLEVLRQRDLLAIARANIEDHLKILDTIKTGAKAGTVTEGDAAQATARLAQARATASATEQDLRTAESLFLQKVGEMPGDMAFPEIPRDKLPATVEDAVRDAATNSPTLSVFETDEKVAYAEYKGSGSTLYPRIEVQAQASEGNNLGGFEGNANSESLMGVMRWNLYRGGADVDRQHEFLYRHAQSKERRAQAARQVDKEMRDTWAGMVSASDRARQFLDQANANEKVVNVYLDQFNLDRRTLLDVLDAQNELFVSRSSHISALYTEMFAVFRVLAIEGRLLSTLGIPRPRESHVTQKN